MHSIHILLFDLLNWKVYLLLLLFFVWNGEKPCTRNILDSSRNGFSFCLKAEKTFLTTFFFLGCQMWKSPDQGLNLHHSCDPSNSDNARSLTSWATRELPKVLLLFAFYFVYGVYIEHRNQLERQCPGTGLTQPLTALEMQLRRASEQGKLLCVCVGSLDERLHVQQLNGRSVFYIYLYDIFGLYPLMEIYIVFDRLFFQLNVLLTVCSPLNAFFILVGRHKYLRETTLW